MATSKQIIRASRDSDLKERLVAIAAAENIESPIGWVEANMHRLVATDLGDNASLASVYEYAESQYVPVPTPGANSAIMTDALISVAINKIKETT